MVEFLLYTAMGMLCFMAAWSIAKRFIFKKDDYE